MPPRRLNLARVYELQYRHSEAEVLLKRALPDFESSGIAWKITSGICLSTLGTVYMSEARFEEAENLFKRALEIFTNANAKNNNSTNSRESLMAIPILNLGILYEKQHRYAEAEALLKQSISSLGKSLGGHPTMASMVAQLALIYANQGRLRESEELLDRALPRSLVIFTRTPAIWLA
jgi:tetratricopeptide (TPR) repeat protein